MSTRSTIGIIDQTKGIVKGVYCHCDGYIGWNGVILDAMYNTLEKAKELISLGSISSLGYEITKEKIDFKRYMQDTKYFETMKYYTIVSQNQDRISNDLENFHSEEFCYVYNPDSKKWMVRGGEFDKWIELKIAIRAELDRGIFTVDNVEALGYFSNEHKKAIQKNAPEMLPKLKEWEEIIKKDLKEIATSNKYVFKQKLSYKDFANIAKMYNNKNAWTGFNIYKIEEVDFKNEQVKIVSKQGEVKQKKILNLIFDVKNFDYGITNPSAIKQWKQFKD